MIRENKLTLTLTSIVILLPILCGVALWDRLPVEIATHWGADGSPNSWSARWFAVFGIPVVILALHWFCVICTHRDKRNSAQNKKIIGLVLWVCPAVSLFVCAVMYAHALGNTVNVATLAILFCGLLGMAMGNYLPKCLPSHTVGIRTKWTLASEENWIATHRFSGRLWVVIGLLMLLCALLPHTVSVWIMAALIIILVAAPLLFSWRFSKTHKGEKSE